MPSTAAPADTPAPKDVEELWKELGGLGVPLICAGGVGDEQHFVEALRIGYAGVQMGTRFIATPECKASEVYKQAIVKAHADDIVLSERITGVPVAVINTPYIQRMGLHAGAVRPVDAARPPPEAVDAQHLRAQVALPAQARLARRVREQGLLAGGEERGRHHRHRAGRSDS